MVITAWVISLLAILLTPILLLRIRKRWVAAFNLAVTNRITSLALLDRLIVQALVRDRYGFAEMWGRMLPE